MKAFLLILFAMILVVGVKAECTDTDYGNDIWVPGYVTDSNGLHFDSCDGEYLKEFYCLGNQSAFIEMRCSAFNAVCVEGGDITIPDYCKCAPGFILDKQTDTCVVSNDVIEYDVVIAILIAVGIIALIMTSRQK